jgi:hypothetical protein
MKRKPPRSLVISIVSALAAEVTKDRTATKRHSLALIAGSFQFDAFHFGANVA